jgi:hypothetical protein
LTEWCSQDFALIRLSKLKDVVSDVAGKELTDLFFMRRIDRGTGPVLVILDVPLLM